MKLTEWLGENIVYRYVGNFYSAFHDHVFAEIKPLVPPSFKGRVIHDLGAGDGRNSLRVHDTFEARETIACDHNLYLLKRAAGRGLAVQQIDLNHSIPRGEMATFIYALHHVRDKEAALAQVSRNFDFVFLCEPMNDLYHRLFDGGDPLSRQGWSALFHRTLGSYEIHQYKNNLFVFHPKAAA